jgi:hypothetical protein
VCLSKRVWLCVVVYQSILVSYIVCVCVCFSIKRIHRSLAPYTNYNTHTATHQQGPSATCECAESSKAWRKYCSGKTYDPSHACTHTLYELTEQTHLHTIHRHTHHKPPPTPQITMPHTKTILLPQFKQHYHPPTTIITTQVTRPAQGQSLGPKSLYGLRHLRLHQPPPQFGARL